ncbi:TetR/AcrR family transcriptional regulator [Streptomyces sp. NBC_00481]|uniref:TetR family transcriptional regulator n=1 Tax=unclassified Streptomyces TaxID=2593676 RepID=UPI002DD869D2|nr:TetR family transcriptional regulator [Streptomyces sp. NBC_00481]WRZ00912.1 TetR/AcrR family transcriptional regulator [Streptomyces sp. NBC_00481]
MTGAVRPSTRDIARAAIRSELAQVAFDLFRRDGFDNVTVNDLAAAAGVSRSTFLRYFGSKEDAVLGAVDARGEQVADALRARPADEDDWTALRRALDAVTEPHRQDPDGTLEMSQLIMRTPALGARTLEKQNGWRPVIAQALAERADPSWPTLLVPLVRAAAALDCLNIAVDRWSASDGRLDLEALLDEAFAAFVPR